MISLRIKNIGKAFRSFRYSWHRFARWFGIPITPIEEKWVLKHISFAINDGNAVGIIGQNGAGKSTLLKLIAGTLHPTEGKVQHNGRIAAILELGMGFNPELSGRQNAFHAAGLMGFSASEIKEAMPEIEAFAEIGEYFNEPVRTYSSGMQIRVAFAVATAYRPDILIVDEALSVGDAYFQHKSFGRIREFQEKGTTLLIVSHDRSAIQNLCDRAILLENGTVIKDGNPEEVFDYYNAIIAEKENSTIDVRTLENGKVQTRSGTGEAKVDDIALYNANGDRAECIGVGEKIEIRIRVKIYESIDNLVFGYGLKDRLGQVMYGTNTWHTDQMIRNANAGETYEIILSLKANLGVGSYSIQTALTSTATHHVHNYEWRDLALMFHVINFDKHYFDGVLWSEPIITIKTCGEI